MDIKLLNEILTKVVPAVAGTIISAIERERKRKRKK